MGFFSKTLWGKDKVKHIRMFLLVILSATYSTAQAEFRWMSIQEIIDRGGSDISDVTDSRGYWAGRIVAVGVYDNDSQFKFAGNVKVKITWVTDRTDYQCHQVYEMQQSDVTDFTHRSLMLTKCN